MTTPDTAAPQAPPVTGGWPGEHIRAERGRGGATVAGLDGHPVLERAVERRRDAVLLAPAVGAANASLPIVIGVLHLALSDAGAVESVVVTAVLVTLVGALAARAHRSLRVRAVEGGVDRVAVVDGRGHGPWVDTGDLVEVEVRAGGRGSVLLLRDDADRAVLLPCGLVEANSGLWSLLHARITASEADGAVIGPRTRRRLDLPLVWARPTDDLQEAVP